MSASRGVVGMSDFSVILWSCHEYEGSQCPASEFSWPWVISVLASRVVMATEDIVSASRIVMAMEDIRFSFQTCIFGMDDISVSFQGCHWYE